MGQGGEIPLLEHRFGRIGYYPVRHPRQRRTQRYPRHAYFGKFRAGYLGIGAGSQPVHRCCHVNYRYLQKLTLAGNFRG